MVQPGDEVIIPEPCFVCYEPITQLTGGVPVHIATRAEDQFRLTADQLRAAITPRTKLLIFPYPNNPTGGVMDAADLEAIVWYMIAQQWAIIENDAAGLSAFSISDVSWTFDKNISETWQSVISKYQRW